jgi:hypothetical protein
MGAGRQGREAGGRARAAFGQAGGAGEGWNQGGALGGPLGRGWGTDYCIGSWDWRGPAKARR